MYNREEGIAPPDPSKINDPRHWRDRADQAHAIAAAMTDPEAKEAMLRVAQEYERLAQHAEERLAR